VDREDGTKERVLPSLRSYVNVEYRAASMIGRRITRAKRNRTFVSVPAEFGKFDESVSAR